MRKSSLKDMSSDFVSGDFDADDYKNLESGSEDHEIDDHHISNQPVDDSSSSEDAEFNEALFEFYKKEKIRSLKRKFRSRKNEHSCKNKRKKPEHETSESVAFTRFSVYYLDFVNFGPIQVKGSIPRINHWKCGMIKQYSELDQISSHSYAKRPILDISDTCYFQHVNCAEERSNRTKGVYLVDHTSDKDDIAEFKAKLELCVGSKLPNETQKSSLKSCLLAMWNP